MRIGIDARPIESDKPTGIGVYLASVLNYIFKHDKENEYFLFSTTELKGDVSFDKNVKSVVIPAKIGTLWVRYTLPKYIKKYEISLFWGTEHMLPKRVEGVRYVLTVHDIALMINKKWGSRKNALMQNMFGKPSIKQADKIITISESTKRDLINRLSIKENKIEAIHIAANGAPETPLLKTSEITINKFSCKSGQKYFYYVGSIEPRKNIEKLIKAYDQFAEDHKDYSLVLAGGLGWRYGKILKAYENAKNKNSIYFLGYLKPNEKDFLYRNCTALAFPTNYEGFGIPVLEAMSYGKPVLTSNNSSLPEIGGDLAFYCESNSINSIKDVMIKIDSLSINEIEHLSKKEKEHFKKFSWEKCGEKTLAVLLNEGENQ